MAAYAGAGAALLLLLGSKKGGGANAPAGAQPIYCRMRWISYAWHLVLPLARMHPPPPPGQNHSTGVWLYWKIKPGAKSIGGFSVLAKTFKLVAGQYFYVWVPRNNQIQSVNGYWIYNSPKGTKPPAPPPSAASGKWTHVGHQYFVWIPTAQASYDDSLVKQFAWFSFHKAGAAGAAGNVRGRQTAGQWYASKIIATSAPGVTLPNEVGPGNLPVFLETPAMAAQDAQALQAAGGSVSTTTAPTPMVAAPSAAPTATAATAAKTSAASAAPAQAQASAA